MNAKALLALGVWISTLAAGCGAGDGDKAATVAAPDAGKPDTGLPDAGRPDTGLPDAGEPTLGTLVRDGQPSLFQAPRPAYGAMVVAHRGERSYVVESRRDVEPGPFGLPWRSRFRLAAYDAGVEAWAYVTSPDDVIGDVVVHPSGEVTLSYLRHAPARMAYDLVRLAADGTPIGHTTLAQPLTVPESDYGALDPRPLFRMKSSFADALTAGWVRLLADDEGVVAVFLSFVDVPESSPLVNRLALGIAAFDWKSSAYQERWARVVEGTHAAEPAAWAYDELRWREQAIRPFVARDESSGHLLVARAWNESRCAANVGTFAEFTPQNCVAGSVGVLENERLPLAVTRFDQQGTRLGTRILVPDADAAEQVPFALAAREGQLAVVGSVVRTQPDGTRRMYEGNVDYDGYAAVYDAEGQVRSSSDFNLGRGDVLSAMRWTSEGIVAVGSAGWDRGPGGMSISRGADPLFVWLSPDDSRAEKRVLPLSTGARHFNLHDLVVLDGAIVGYGISDAPMTHSADGGNHAARSFGPLRIRLSAPSEAGVGG